MPIRFGSVEGCVVMVQSGPASDQEWGGYLDFLGPHLTGADRHIALIVADGGPTPSQRAKLEEVTRRFGRSPRAAVLSRSTFVRGLVKAMSLFSRDEYRSFGPAEARAALEYLGVPRGHHAPIVEALSRWCRELGMPPLPALV